MKLAAQPRKGRLEASRRDQKDDRSLQSALAIEVRAEEPIGRGNAAVANHGDSTIQDALANR